jgi:hypothetical protein
MIRAVNKLNRFSIVQTRLGKNLFMIVYLANKPSSRSSQSLENERDRERVREKKRVRESL